MDIMELGELLGKLSPAAMLGVFIWAIAKRMLILPRELDEAQKRIAELKGERDEFKGLLYKALNIGERAATVAEDREKHERY